MLKPEETIAELLHTKLCTSNHDDRCGWDYESWERPGYSRSEYLKKATKILGKVTFSQAKDVIKII
jgi:hypothetical protein